MKTSSHDAQAAKLLRRARLHALLFAGTALGTTLLVQAGWPKFPNAGGE